jgi:putative nucleotidyltransferase with HDIG domain
MTLPTDTTRARLRTFFTERHLRADTAVKVLLGIVLVLLGSLMFPHPENLEYGYAVGSVWVEKDLVAAFPFPIFKDLQQYERECREAARVISPVFERREELTRSCTDSARTLVLSLRGATEIRSRWLKTHAQRDSVQFVQASGRIPFVLTPAEWNSLRGVSYEALENTLTLQLNELLKAGIIDQAKVRQPQAQLALRKGRMEELLLYSTIYELDEAVNVLPAKLTAGNRLEGSLALKIARALVKPNLLFNRAATQQEIATAEENVPRTVGFVQENERIISKNDRITDESRLKLESYVRAKAEIFSVSADWKHWIGTVLHVCVILALYGLYLFLFRRGVFADNGKLGLIAILFLMMMVFAYLTVFLNPKEPLQYLIVVPVASMLLTIIFDSRLALYATVTVAFLVAGIRGNDYTIALVSLVAGALGVYTVRDIRNRTQIFRSIVFIFLGYAVSILAVSLQQFEATQTLLIALFFGLANAVFSSVLTYGILIFLERVFRVTTDLRLLELSDFNRPLLRQLSEKAPGTFHHSLTIGTLAEAAAEAIGANSVLARVGGYYHDIGKMEKAEYFVENQIGSQSRHGRLKPRMSALIIASHVREGIELARENGLPEKLIDFIPQHHGTTRISFFYDKALRQAAKRPTKEIIQEEDFLYPGPKPQSKELGIVMLADSVEASTRAIEDMTPQKLEHMIDTMIKHRFLEGQLDECDLTMRDLGKIREAFLKILTGIHHTRLRYPNQQPAEAGIPPERPAETPPMSPAPEPAPAAPAPGESQKGPAGPAEPGPVPGPAAPGESPHPDAHE